MWSKKLWRARREKEGQKYILKLPVREAAGSALGPAARSKGRRWEKSVRKQPQGRERLKNMKRHGGLPRE